MIDQGDIFHSQESEMYTEASSPILEEPLYEDTEVVSKETFELPSKQTTTLADQEDLYEDTEVEPPAHVHNSKKPMPALPFNKPIVTPPQTINTEDEYEDTSEVQKVEVQRSFLFSKQLPEKVQNTAGGCSPKFPQQNLGIHSQPSKSDAFPSKQAPPLPSRNHTEAVDDFDENIDYENVYLAVWDCIANQDDELNLKKGDMVHIIGKEYDSCGWWVGEYLGKIGIVPKQFLRPAYILT